MEREYHLETYDRCIVEKVESLIAGLQHDIRQLELSIAAEEDRAGTAIPPHYAYPFNGAGDGDALHQFKSHPGRYRTPAWG
jgi:hypothetical protein